MVYTDNKKVNNGMIVNGDNKMWVNEWELK